MYSFLLHDKPAAQLIIDDLAFYKVHTGYHLVCCAVGDLAQQNPGSNQQPGAPAQEQPPQVPAPQEQPAAASDGLAGMDISAADHPVPTATSAAGDQLAAAAGDLLASAADDQLPAAFDDQLPAASDDQLPPPAAAGDQQPAVAAQQHVRNKQQREPSITEGEELPGACEREPAPRKPRTQRKSEADAVAEQLDDAQQPAASIDDAGDAPAGLASQSADESLPDAAAAEHAAVPTAHESDDAGIQDAATAKKLRKEEKKLRKEERAAKRAQRAAEEAAADLHTAEADAPASASAPAAEPAVSQCHPDHPNSSKGAQDAGAEAEGTAAAGTVPQHADDVAACSQPEHQGKYYQATCDVLLVHTLHQNLLCSLITGILVFLTLGCL